MAVRLVVDEPPAGRWLSAICKLDTNPCHIDRLVATAQSLPGAASIHPLPAEEAALSGACEYVDKPPQGSSLPTDVPIRHTHSLYDYYDTSNSLRIDQRSGKDVVNVTGNIRNRKLP